jgi:calcineurin-like phosphoesterase family protein
MTLKLLSSLISLGAGACLFLILLNRVFLQMQDSRCKLPIIRGSMVVIGLGAAAFGYWAAGTRWMLVPALALTAVLAGELHRLAVRRRSRGAAAVETTNVGVSLSKPETTTDLALIRYELPVAGWHDRDLRIVHISDLHVNPRIGAAYYRAVLTRAAEFCPDLLIYTGDFVTHVEHAALLAEILSAAHGRLATLAILGNHDYWVGAEQVAEAVRSAGVMLLGDDCRRIAVDGHELLVCGYQEPWSSARWQPARVKPGELAVALTHTPDNVYRLSRLGFTAIFAGHYHAGQMRLPWLGPLVGPTRRSWSFRRERNASVRERGGRRGRAAQAVLLPAGYFRGGYTCFAP